MSDQSHLSAAVILVTYNRAENVRTCLDHVMRQTLPAAEILVV
ncbi:glycosyltransferase, partial [Propioniciclava sp.]